MPEKGEVIDSVLMEVKVGSGSTSDATEGTPRASRIILYQSGGFLAKLSLKAPTGQTAETANLPAGSSVAFVLGPDGPIRPGEHCWPVANILGGWHHQASHTFIFDPDSHVTLVYRLSGISWKPNWYGPSLP